MKSIVTLGKLLLVAVGALVVQAPIRAAENTADAAELVRSLYKTDRQQFLAGEMRLNERESAAFWPIYRSYRTDMDKLGDRLLNLVLEYRDAYPNVTEEQARTLLKDYGDVEQDIVNTRSRYLKRAAKDVSATRALRWAQLENRMDLGLRLQLASALPLAPESTQSRR